MELFFIRNTTTIPILMYSIILYSIPFLFYTYIPILLYTFEKLQKLRAFLLQTSKMFAPIRDENKTRWNSSGSTSVLTKENRPYIESIYISMSNTSQFTWPIFEFALLPILLLPSTLLGFATRFRS